MSDLDRMSDPNPTPDLVREASARRVCVSDRTHELPSALLKQLTCGEPVSVRALVDDDTHETVWTRLVTAVGALIRRAYRPLRSALLQVRGRASMTSESGTVSTGDQPRRLAPNCRRGEGQ